MPQEIDHSHTYEPVCPYCGYEVRDAWELDNIKAELERLWKIEECALRVKYLMSMLNGEAPLDLCMYSDKDINYELSPLIVKWEELLEEAAKRSTND